MGKKVVVVCQKCGHEYSVEYIESEEAEKRGIRTVPNPPRCPKCRSGQVRVYR